MVIRSDNVSEQFTTYYHSPVGILTIRGTEDYISEVAFPGRSAQEDQAASENPPAMLINCVEQLIQYFNGQRRLFDLPLNQNCKSVTTVCLHVE